MERKSKEIISSKVLPSVSLGILIWLIAFLYTPQYTKISFFVVFGVVYFALWILSTRFAYKKEILASFLTYLGACFVSGLLISPIVGWLMSLPRITDVIAQGIITISLLGAAVGVGLGAYFGWLYRDGILEHIEILWFAIAFGIGITLTEIIGVNLLGFDYLLFWTSIAVIVLMLIFSIYDGAKLRLIVENEPDLWMVAVIDFFLDFVNIAVRLIYILAEAFSKSR